MLPADEARTCAVLARIRCHQSAPLPVAPVTKGESPVKTRQLATDAILAAMCAALGALALDMNSIKITLESFPILLGAMLFGPLDGLVIGAVGTALYQLLRYGVSATTVLWILPYCVCGLLTGWYARKKGYRLTVPQSVGIAVLAELIVTTLNTGVMYVDAKLYGYYFKGFITGMLAIRYLVCVAKAVVYGVLLPRLIGAVRQFVPEKDPDE